MKNKALFLFLLFLFTIYTLDVYSVVISMGGGSTVK